MKLTKKALKGSAISVAGRWLTNGHWFALAELAPGLTVAAEAAAKDAYGIVSIGEAPELEEHIDRLAAADPGSVTLHRTEWVTDAARYETARLYVSEGSGTWEVVSTRYLALLGEPEQLERKEDRNKNPVLYRPERCGVMPLRMSSLTLPGTPAGGMPGSKGGAT